MDDQQQPQFDYQTPDDIQKQEDLSRPSYSDQTSPAQEDSGAYNFAASQQAVDLPSSPPSQSDSTPLPPEPNPSPSSYMDPSVPTPIPETVYTGLSGNEMYCLDLVGYRPGDLLVGNSVYALGFIGGMASSIRTTLGGEIQQYTNMISGGRKLSIQRLEQELAQCAGHGATGVTSELIFHPGNVEFLSVGSSIYKKENQGTAIMTTASDGQEFYCQLDAGYTPMRFVLGNVAYSIGIGRTIMGEFKEMVRGEIHQYSNVFNITRNLALERIIQEAKAYGANSVVGIRTTILPIGTKGVQEMVMIGTASYNQQTTNLADSIGGVLTSDLTAEEMWNVTKLGYAPLKLILGTSVYSLGLMGGARAAVRSFAKGEINTLTQLIYGAREESLKKVQQQAQEIGADSVLGIKTYIYQLEHDVIEFLVIGTAVKKVNGITTRSNEIPPQAVMPDKNTFINTANVVSRSDLDQSSVNYHNQDNIV